MPDAAAGEGSFLSPSEMIALADALGDTPETVMAASRLRLGLARALVAGEAGAPRAAVVQLISDPSYPAGFGNDPDALWALLRQLPSWEAVHVTPPMAPLIAERITAATGLATLPIEELYYTLDHPAPVIPHVAVRWLTLEDEPLLVAATEPLDMAGWRLGSAHALLTGGLATGAVVNGALVAAAFSSALSPAFREIGVVTHPDWRGQGLAPATAALLAAGVQARGLGVVWSTSEENLASQRVAEKLGFREVCRRVYVNLVPPSTD